VDVEDEKVRQRMIGKVKEKISRTRKSYDVKKGASISKRTGKYARELTWVKLGM
jgi:hypothetical protein